MTDKIERVELTRVKLRLTEPYHLSHVTIESFDSIFVRVETNNGAKGIGEVTTLDGYSSETTDEAWVLLSEFADQIVGMTITEAIHSADKIGPNRSFTRSGARCALYRPVSYPQILFPLLTD